MRDEEPAAAADRRDSKPRLRRPCMTTYRTSDGTYLIAAADGRRIPHQPQPRGARPQRAAAPAATGHISKAKRLKEKAQKSFGQVLINLQFSDGCRSVSFM